MATIRARKTADGSTRYTAVVRIRKGNKVAHQEAKTFTHRGAATLWAKSREVVLEDPVAFAREQHGAPSLRELIRWYIDNFSDVSKWQRSKQAHLELLERHEFSERNAVKVTVQDLVNHIRSRRADGAGPATVANDLIWIGVVLRAAKSVRGIPVSPAVVSEARDACHALRLTGKAKKRTRRPTAEELKRLDAFFARRDGRSQIQMRDIMWFAIHSARRQSEICRIEWNDNNPGHQTGIVRDAKHPTAKEGNDRVFKYTPEAWAIVKRQKKTESEFIFPYEPTSVGNAFTKACQVLGIHDLRFHDLRHEATSRLFEMGYQIHEVAQFTLHDSWNELKRYANLRPENLREIGKNNQLVSGTNTDLDSSIGSSAVRQPSRAADRSSRPDRRH